MYTFALTALVASIASAADLRTSSGIPAELTLAEVNAQVEAGCPGDDHHHHCGGCCHSHCGGCCHNHCDCDSDDTDPEPEPCDTNERNCRTPSFCYGTIGWTVEEVL